jgi:hypothetical protein
VASDRKRGATRLPAPATRWRSLAMTSNRKTVMTTRACLALLVGGWVSAAAEPALAPAHACLFVNRPPTSVAGEGPHRFSGLAAGWDHPWWTAAGAAGLTGVNFPWRTSSAVPDTPVLLAASDDAQPVPAPAEGPGVRRRADAAPTDARVNAVRRDRVLRRASPRGWDARWRTARLYRPPTQGGYPAMLRPQL